MSDDDGVLAGTGGNGEFDLGVGGGEFGEERLDEATAHTSASMRHWNCHKAAKRSLLHALRATSPVSIVEVQLLALQDEGTNAVLWWPSVSIDCSR